MQGKRAKLQKLTKCSPMWLLDVVVGCGGHWSRGHPQMFPGSPCPRATMQSGISKLPTARPQPSPISSTGPGLEHGGNC